MSTFAFSLALFLHTFRPCADLGNGLVIARRLRYAALFQDLRPVHYPLPLSLVFGFFTLKRAKDKSPAADQV